MGPYQTQWRTALATMVAQRGKVGTLDAPGPEVALPRLIGLDLVLLLAQYTRVVRAVVVEYNFTGETITQPDAGFVDRYNPDQSITVDAYLGKAIPQGLERASRRYIARTAAPYGTKLYGPYEPDAKWSGALELVSTWQNLVNQVAAVISAGPQLEQSESVVRVFCDTIDSATYTIDTTNTMPSSYLGAVKYTIVNSISAAKDEALTLTHDTIVAAGGLAGDAANAAADAAGKGFAEFVKSFLGGATFTALLVAGIAVYAWHAGVI